VTATLCASGIGKRYGARAVFRNVGFAIESGAVAAIVGANGAGKSTLLRIVAGLVRPTAGRVVWRSEPGREYTLPAAHCGLAAPDAPVYRELTALENLEFFATARGLAMRREQLRQHLKGFGLSGREDDAAGDLSSGLRARLALAVATLHTPAVLLLDEPAANLDEAGREVLQRVLAAQRGRGVALVATNDSREAQSYDTCIAV
jgi:heme exporter protein A